jgi:hypothetical protein
MAARNPFRAPNNSLFLTGGWELARPGSCFLDSDGGRRDGRVRGKHRGDAASLAVLIAIGPREKYFAFGERRRWRSRTFL